MRIMVHREGAAPADVTEAVQIVYDALHSSMDLGSGFLDGDEEEAMRSLAEAAGFERPQFPHDECVCGHTMDLHYSAGCRGGVQVRAPEYKRVMSKRLVPAKITDEEHDRVQRALRGARNQDEVNMILAGAASKIAIVEEEYEVTICVDAGERTPCDCPGFRFPT